jgi:hypothetical protein
MTKHRYFMYVIQDQVLIGTILGGSSLVKPPKGINYYLSMRSQNELWLEYKMQQMSDLFSSPKINWYNNTFRCNSSCSEKLTVYYNEMYDGNRRKITMSLLDKLKDIGIAVWFLESGSKTGRNRKNAYINTTKFGEDGTKIVHQYFNEVDLECNVNRDGKRIKVLFTVEGTLNLFRVIAHEFPKFMLHRI